MPVLNIELKCAHELAYKLGAIEAVNGAHFRAMRESGAFIIVRDPETLQALFWPLTNGRIVSRESS